MRVTISSATSRPFRFDGKVYRIFRSDSAYSVRKKPKKTPSTTAPCLLRSGALPTVGQPVVQRLIGRESLVYHPVDLSFLSPLLVYLLLVPVYSPRLDSRRWTGFRSAKRLYIRQEGNLIGLPDCTLHLLRCIFNSILGQRLGRRGGLCIPSAEGEPLLRSSYRQFCYDLPAHYATHSQNGVIGESHYIYLDPTAHLLHLACPNRPFLR